MKRLIYLFYAIACAGSVKGQDLKSVHPVFIEINSKNPDKAVFGDDQISIKFLDIKSDLLKLEFENRTDRNIEFVRKKSYTLIDGTANDTYIGYERDNAATYQKNDLIPKSSKITSILFPGSFFDYSSSKKYFKNYNGPKHNKLVLAFEIDGKEKEYTLDVAIYPKKIKQSK